MRNILSIVPLLLLFIIWEGLARLGIINVHFFPSPSSIIATLYHLSLEGSLIRELTASMSRLAIATLITVPAAYTLALITSHSKKLNFALSPIIGFAYPVPKIAIFPLLLLVFGIDDSSKIVLISIGIFFLVYINIRNSMQELVSSELYNLTKIYKIRQTNYAYYVVFRGTLRSLLVGLFTGINYGLTLTVVSEFSVSRNGIGHFIWNAWDQFRISDMYAAILLLALVGLVINLFFEWCFKKSIVHSI